MPGKIPPLTLTCFAAAPEPPPSPPTSSPPTSPPPADAEQSSAGASSDTPSTQSQEAADAYPVLRNLSVATRGEARGHQLYLEDRHLQQIAQLGLGYPQGVKVRFGHPDFRGPDAIGAELGCLRAFRVVRGHVLADFHPIPTAHNRKALDHVYVFAQAAPEHLGLSMVFQPCFTGGQELREGRRYEAFEVEQLLAIDFVSDPAANPAGLFPPANLLSNHQAELLPALQAHPALAQYWAWSAAAHRLQLPATYHKVLQQPTEPPISEADTPAAPPVWRDKLRSVLGFGQWVLGRPEQADNSHPPAGQATEQAAAPPHNYTEWPLAGGGRLRFQGADPQAGDIPLLLAARPAPAQLPGPGAYPLATGQTALLGADSRLAALAEPHSDVLFNHYLSMATQTPASTPLPEFTGAAAADKPAAPASAGPKRAAYSSQDAAELALAYHFAKLNQLGVPGYSDYQLTGPGRISNLRSPEANARAFSSTLDVSSVTARVAEVSNLVLTELFHADPFIRAVRTLNNTTRNGLNNFTVDVPLIDAADLAWQRGALGSDPSETGALTFSQRTVTVRPISLAHSICVDDLRDVYQGGVYVNNETLPLESYLLELFGASLSRDLVNQALNGNYDNGADRLTGLMTLVDAAVAGGGIPAAQAPEQSAYTTGNAIAQVEEVVEASTEVMKGREDLLLFCDFAIRNKYVQNYRTTFGSSFGAVRPDQAEYTQNIRPMARFVPMLQLPEDRVLLTPGSNILLVLQDQNAQDPLEVFYDPNSRRMKMRWETFAGVHYGRPELLVTNTLADPTA